MNSLERAYMPVWLLGGQCAALVPAIKKGRYVMKGCNNVMVQSRPRFETAVEMAAAGARFLRRLAAKVAVLAAVIFCAMYSTVASATESVTLPETGVDMPGLIGAALLVLGAVVTAVIAGYFAFRVIKIGLRWVGKIGG